MTTSSGLAEVENVIDRQGQTLWVGTGPQQHLCFSAGPFWHLHHRRLGPATMAAA